MKVDENGRKSIEVDESQWKSMKVDESGLKKMKVVESSILSAYWERNNFDRIGRISWIGFKGARVQRPFGESPKIHPNLGVQPCSSVLVKFEIYLRGFDVYIHIGHSWTELPNARKACAS